MKSTPIGHRRTTLRKSPEILRTIGNETVQEKPRTMIEVKDLKKRFSTLQVLDGCSFTVDRGQVLVVIGPSGSGKSTMLRCVNFLEEYDGGEVWIDGQSVGYEFGANGARKRQSERRIAELRAEVGIVFQSFNLFPHRNVIDNIMMAPMNVRGVRKSEASDIARELLGKVGLEDKTFEYPSKLSGGQQQRVAIARALAMQPKVMLFDEVTSALDPELVGEVLQVMRQLAEEGMTMMIVTHEMHFARDVGDQLLFIDEGKIVEEGPPADILANPQSERLQTFISRFKEAGFL